MRRIGSVLFALALVGSGVGCSSKNNISPPSGTTTSTSTTSSTGSTGSTGSSSGSGSTSASSSGSGSSGSGGAVDAGACSDPNTQLEFKTVPGSLSLSGANGPSSATLVVHAFLVQNGAFVDQEGCQVQVAESSSDPSRLISVTPQNLLTAADGTASSSVAPFGSAVGVATVNARLVGGASTAAISATINVNTIPDGGQTSCGDLTGANIILDSPTPPVTLAPNSSAVLTFHALDANNMPVGSCSLSFQVTSPTPALTFTAASAQTDQFGNFSATIQAGSVTGSNGVKVSMSGVSLTVPVNIIISSTDAGLPTVDAGSPAATQLIYVSGDPADHLINVAGTGTDHGQMVFQVLDQYGQPLSNANVSFRILDSSIVSLTNQNATTGPDGKAVVFYAAASQHPGSTTLQASLDTGITITESISVHSGKPSWKNFQFYCDTLNIPIYTFNSNTQTVKCHVQLGDRFGNAVDTQPTVNFYAESGTFVPGSIQVDASGFADVDFVAAPSPVDVTPLVSNPAQYPVPLAANEPTTQNGALTINPRDQLVTLVAVTEGEEAIDPDSNTFIDLSDPYLDANDDNAFDSTAGHSETRICTAPFADGGCAPFSAGNGVWDANTSIWVERHAVFSGTPKLRRTDTFGNASPLPNCLPEGQVYTVDLFAYDSYLNEPAGQSVFAVIGGSGGVSGSLSLLSNGLDNTGSIFYNANQWGIYTVAESDGGACDAANGSACQPVYLIEDFGSGFNTTLTITNGNNATGGAGVLVDGGAPSCIPASVTVQATAQSGALTTSTYSFTVQQ